MRLFAASAVAALALGAAVGAAPAAVPPTVVVPVLMYHRIDRHHPWVAPITARLTVEPGQFAAEMQWLHDQGFHAVTQKQAYAALEQGGTLPPKPVMITFDDGYTDVLRHAAPVLVRLHLPATAFVITGRTGGPERAFLSWAQLAALERDGVEIGSHTVTHRELTLLSDADAFAELRDSRLALERHLHHAVPWIAYPAGKEDSRVVRLALRAGYRLGYTTHPGRDQWGGDPLELKRFEVLDSTGVSGLAALLGGS